MGESGERRGLEGWQVEGVVVMADKWWGGARGGVKWQAKKRGPCKGGNDCEALYGRLDSEGVLLEYGFTSEKNSCE